MRITSSRLHFESTLLDSKNVYIKYTTTNIVGYSNSSDTEKLTLDAKDAPFTFDGEKYITNMPYEGRNQ
jgi:hypothetical protein